MGEKGGSKNWSVFLHDAHGVGDEYLDEDVPRKKFVSEKPKPKAVEAKKTVPTSSDSKWGAHGRSAVDAQNAENSLYLTILKGNNMKRLAGESDEDFKNRKINDRGQRQYEAALKKLGGKLKIDLTRPGAVDLLRASYRSKLADKALNGKPNEQRQSLRRLSKIFGITDIEEVEGILDVGLQDEDASTWLSESENSKERAHMIGLARLALNGDEGVRLNLEKQYGIEGAKELMAMVEQLGLV